MKSLDRTELTALTLSDKQSCRQFTAPLSEPPKVVVHSDTEIRIYASWNPTVLV